jgi:hypothetical protein
VSNVLDNRYGTDSFVPPRLSVLHPSQHVRTVLFVVDGGPEEPGLDLIALPCGQVVEDQTPPEPAGLVYGVAARLCQLADLRSCRICARWDPWCRLLAHSRLLNWRGVDVNVRCL